MDISQRPREKALAQGIQVLSNRELLAILLRSGTKACSVLELADQILKMRNNFSSLAMVRLEEWMSISGIKQAKALQLMALFELSLRLSQQKAEGVVRLEELKPLAQWLNKYIGYQEQEHFVVLFLDVNNAMIAYKTIFIGTNNKSWADPKIIFSEALRCANCTRIICVHNHPSGDVTPSSMDNTAATRIEMVSEVVNIDVMDHIIVGKNAYYSYFQHQQMLHQQRMSLDRKRKVPAFD